MTGQLTFNDNDNPTALNIGAFFNTAGDGNAATIAIQTLAGQARIHCRGLIVNNWWR